MWCRRGNPWSKSLSMQYRGIHADHGGDPQRSILCVKVLRCRDTEDWGAMFLNVAERPAYTTCCAIVRVDFKGQGYNGCIVVVLMGLDFSEGGVCSDEGSSGRHCCNSACDRYRCRCAIVDRNRRKWCLPLRYLQSLADVHRDTFTS
jgi:hypothetical protein